MSSFNGQMKEYTGIAIDRFDGKNLQCTAFFLSHCHTDHMVGLDRPSFIHSLSARNGVFLYCSEITSLLLLSDKIYRHLTDYIHVLKVGIPQPIRIPSRSKFENEYCVNVTPISAGHCPGSVMFLFDGPEGTCLYTGDFRWEISHSARVAAFKQENGLRSIKSMYVDTTFCIPEAYYIPTRNECVDAAVTLVSNWLKLSLMHVVFVYCPAKYGHEHLLMEMSKKLNTKIHVPDWKVQIYDQIPDLKNAFTSDSSQARIHACSIRVGCTSCLLCHSTPGDNKHYKVLKLRPSTMWFTSGRTISKTDDLIVAPVSHRGLYRICYSMHSSYSEIRDLVSYLQPKQAFPSVLPMSDTSMDAVQTRLNSFQKYLNKARVFPTIAEAHFQPLGALRKTLIVQASTKEPSCKQDTESSDGLVFSSEESRPEREFAENFGEGNQSTMAQNKISPMGELYDSSTSQSLSSYQNSVTSGEEFKLLSDDTDDDKIVVLQTNQDSNCNEDTENSFRIYISGDSSVGNSSDDSDVDLKDDYDSGVFNSVTRNINISEPDKTCIDNSTVSQSKLEAFGLNIKKINKCDAVSKNGTNGQNLGILTESYERLKNGADNDKKVENMQQKQVKKMPIFSCDINFSSLEIPKNSESDNKKVVVGDLENNNNFCDGHQDQNETSGENDEIVYSSQVAPGAELIQNSISEAVFQKSSNFHHSGNIKAAHNDLKTRKDTKSNSLPALNHTDVDSKDTEALIISSSPDDSDKESQTLWSVKYSLDHFIPNDKQGEPHNSSIINATDSHKIPQNVQFSKSRKRRELINISSLKTKLLPTNRISASTSQPDWVKIFNRASTSQPDCVKRSTSARTSQSNCVKMLRLCASVEDEDEVFIDKKDNCTLFSKRKKCARSSQETSGSLMKLQNDFPLDNSNPKGKDMAFSLSDSSHYVLKSSDSRRHADQHHEEVLPKNVQMCEKSDWIDLTIEMPENVIDLTLDSSQ